VILESRYELQVWKILKIEKPRKWCRNIWTNKYFFRLNHIIFNISYPCTFYSKYIEIILRNVSWKDVLSLYLGHCIDWLIKKCLQLTCNNPLLCLGAKWVKPILLGKYMRLRSQTKRISDHEKKDCEKCWIQLNSYLINSEIPQKV